MSHKKLSRIGGFLRVKISNKTLKQFMHKKIDGNHIIEVWGRNGKWSLYAYLFNIRDIKSRRDRTMNYLRRLNVSESELKRMRILK